jgi:hypothetical protein
LTALRALPGWALAGLMMAFAGAGPVLAQDLQPVPALTGRVIDQSRAASWPTSKPRPGLRSWC